MATGETRYADISSLVPDIYEGAVFGVHWNNVLVPTVKVFRDTMGMNPRKGSIYGNGNLRQVAEGEDITPTAFTRTAGATLTPVIFRDQFLITDQRFRTDPEAVRDDAVLEMGAQAAESIDTAIAAVFPSLTGGTVGAFLGTVNWGQLFAARSILQQNKIQGPYYAALGAGQWYHLAFNGGTVDSSFIRSDVFQDRIIMNYFTSPVMGDVTFVVTPNIDGHGGGSATGAMYSEQALAYDERRGFYVAEQRDESKGATELNYGVEYAAGVWRPTFGVQIRSTDVIPTT